MINIKKIIEQEVDKQEWGLELPNKVKLNNKTLMLTDRGVYQGDNIEVEYKVDNDTVLTIDGTELIPIDESEFDWISDIGNTVEFITKNSFNIYVPSGFNQMKELSNILTKQFLENLTDAFGEVNEWPTVNDLKIITKNATRSVWISVDKEFNNSWSKTWEHEFERGEHTMDNDVQAKDFVITFNSLNESNDFDWVNDTPTTIEYEWDIPSFISRSMYNINVDTGKSVNDVIYWIEKNGEEPEAYNVCWKEGRGDVSKKQKICTRFRASTIVKMFNHGELIFIEQLKP